MTSRTEKDLTYTQVWNAENRLASVSGAATAQFNYDGDGNRIVKVDASGTTLYLGAAYEKNLTTNVVTKYYYLGGQRIAVRQNGVLTYLHADALGSASLATTVTGTLVSQRRYLPYGETRWSSSPFPTDRRFTGQREEVTLGVYDYGARFYSPGLGRFIQPDPLSKPENPQTWNPYAYALNNPLRYIDPTGYLPEDLIPEYVTSDLDKLPPEVLKMLQVLHFGDFLVGRCKEVDYLSIVLGRAILDDGHNLAFADPATGAVISIGDVINMYEKRALVGLDVYAPGRMTGVSWLSATPWQESVPLANMQLIYSTMGYAQEAGYVDYDVTVQAWQVAGAFELPMAALGAGVGGWPGFFIGLGTSSIVPKGPGQAADDRVLTTIYSQYGGTQDKRIWVQRTVLRGDQVLENKILSYEQYLYQTAQGW